ncbi:ABC transporter ATP-binding protein [Sansalvadorimonas verongulae]|uniref:ABC transporter ATP-binding protein n=1 Tax=Sansalvadorimonas verongulae TaxID=2172824 RepID=UPI0012BC8E7F|nr:ABC transporter ATP-binding protein [Sansalvadorimonas verongulae]MTI13984.1 ABC transporter ATP-binding protein [Sansalvadorimonas verongulae]
MFDISLRNAGLAYGDNQIFRNLNLTLEGGRWTCLLGGSGVGKTTLLRMIAGLTSGRSIRTQGEVVCGDGLPLQGRIAWMSQEDSLLPWADVMDNVTVGHRLRSRSWFRKKKLDTEVKEQALTVLEQVGIVDKACELPQNLSGGQRQRVALARTLMEDRPVVLMDEPFAAVDAITRLDLQDLSCQLLTDRTVLLITHDPLEALRLGHHVYHLRGKPAELTDAIIPPGQTPRSLDNEKLMMLQGKLLDRLRHSEHDEGSRVHKGDIQ